MPPWCWRVAGYMPGAPSMFWPVREGWTNGRCSIRGPVPGPVALPWRGHSIRLGIMTGDDMREEDTAEALAESGAEILIVAGGSPFEADRRDERLHQAVGRSTETGLALIFVNQVGGQGRAGVRWRLVRPRCRPLAGGARPPVRGIAGADRLAPRSLRRSAGRQQSWVAGTPTRYDRIHLSCFGSRSSRLRRQEFDYRASSWDSPGASGRLWLLSSRSTPWEPAASGP